MSNKAARYIRTFNKNKELLVDIEHTKTVQTYKAKFNNTQPQKPINDELFSYE